MNTIIFTGPVRAHVFEQAVGRGVRPREQASAEVKVFVLHREEFGEFAETTIKGMLSCKALLASAKVDPISTFQSVVHSTLEEGLRKGKVGSTLPFDYVLQICRNGVRELMQSLHQEAEYCASKPIQQSDFLKMIANHTSLVTQHPLLFGRSLQPLAKDPLNPQNLEEQHYWKTIEEITHLHLRRRFSDEVTQATDLLLLLNPIVLHMAHLFNEIKLLTDKIFSFLTPEIIINTPSNLLDLFNHFLNLYFVKANHAAHRAPLIALVEKRIAERKRIIQARIAEENAQAEKLAAEAAAATASMALNIQLAEFAAQFMQFPPAADVAMPPSASASMELDLPTGMAIPASASASASMELNFDDMSMHASPGMDLSTAEKKEWASMFFPVPSAMAMPTVPDGFDLFGNAGAQPTQNSPGSTKGEKKRKNNGPTSPPKRLHTTEAPISIGINPARVLRTLFGSSAAPAASVASVAAPADPFALPSAPMPGAQQPVHLIVPKPRENGGIKPQSSS